jgi:hypothetical protein
MFPRRIVQSLQLYTYLEAEGDAVAEELPDHDEALPRARVPAMSSGRACVSVVGHTHVVRGIHDTNPIAERVPSRLEPPRSPHTHPFTVSKPFHHSCKRGDACVPRRSEHGALRLHVGLRIIIRRARGTAAVERAVQTIRNCANQLVAVLQLVLLREQLGPALRRPWRE